MRGSTVSRDSSTRRVLPDWLALFILAVVFFTVYNLIGFFIGH